MNILIPHKWLMEHLQTEATPAQIQKYLSLSGPSVERIYEADDDFVYDIEVTTNRVDCMSVHGIAREAAAILTRAGIYAGLRTTVHIPFYMRQIRPISPSKLSFKMPTIIDNSELCRRIIFMLLTNIQETTTPLWMQTRLKQIGVIPRNPVIDITNYVTHDLGHPCHAFDYDKLMKHNDIIHIIRAAEGKEFTTLDNVTYKTVGGEVVFENEAGDIIDLPGIKGTKNTCIDSSTTRVLFWIESMDPSLIRFTSMTHGIRTVAAQINEKNVDPYLALPTFAMGVELFASLTGATVKKDTFMDNYYLRTNIPVTFFPYGLIQQYLGIDIPREEIKEILLSLGFTSRVRKNIMSVISPTWRPDVTIGQDVIEEIARIYGYHNLPSKLMPGTIPTNRPQETNFDLEMQTKQLLANLGGFEVYTYSMISQTTASKEIQNEKDLQKTHLKLVNPLTDDMVYLRRTLWASHLEILKNQNPKFVFELANVYLPQSISEELHLTLTTKNTTREIKGVLDALLKSLYLQPARYTPQSTSEVIIKSGQVQIGYMKVITEGSNQIITIDLAWNTLVNATRKYPIVRAIPKVSPIIEDMTFAFEKATHAQDIIDTIQHTDPLIARVDYKDRYKQNLTFTVYYQPTDEQPNVDVSPIRKEIIKQLSEKFKAELIGKI